MPVVPFDARVPEWSPGGSYGHPRAAALLDLGRHRTRFGFRESLAGQWLTSGAVALLARGSNSGSRAAKRRHEAGSGAPRRIDLTT
jgi:hypothetical protein